MKMNGRLHASASLTLLLCVVANLCYKATAQNCKTVAPCTDQDSVDRLAAYTNATLFLEAKDECGTSLDAITAAMMASCVDEFDVKPGCDCGTRACKAALQPLVAQTCKRAILKTICRAADWLEPQLGANVRSMYLHVLNDCALGSPEGCSADNFDESLCVGVPAAAPAEVPGPAGSPRCSEELTALFSAGPGPASADKPAEVQTPAPAMAPKPAAPPAAPATVQPPPAPVLVPDNPPDAPVTADPPSQEARDSTAATGDSSEDAASVPEAGAAMQHAQAAVWAACGMVIALVWS